MQTEEDKEKHDAQWLNKVKGDSLTSAVASIGLVTMWEPDNG